MKAFKISLVIALLSSANAYACGAVNGSNANATPQYAARGKIAMLTGERPAAITSNKPTTANKATK